jgi:hypothetical protein
MSTAQSPPPELADAARLARRLVHRAVDAARTEDKSLRRLLLDHLGADAESLPTVSGSWPPYEHVNVQAGLDDWLTGPGRRFELLGVAGAMRGMDYGIGLLIADPGGHGLGSSSRSSSARRRSSRARTERAATPRPLTRAPQRRVRSRPSGSPMIIWRPPSTSCSTPGTSSPGCCWAAPGPAMPCQVSRSRAALSLVRHAQPCLSADRIA